MTKDLIYLSEVEAVSMGDDWFEIATSDHFWMKWRFEEIKKLIAPFEKERESIFEIGCGSATVINQVEKAYNVVMDGCDLNEFALKQAKNCKGNLMIYNIFDKDKSLLNKYSMIFLLDVIEHIDAVSYTHLTLPTTPYV